MAIGYFTMSESEGAELVNVHGFCQTLSMNVTTILSKHNCL